MRKYETEFKFKVVKSYLDGDGGAKLLARQWSVPEAIITDSAQALREEHKDRCGCRRITVALCNAMAEPVNHKCVQRLMQKMGLRAVIRAKRRSRHVSGISDAQVPNALKRDFCATGPNQKGVTDVTELIESFFGSLRAEYFHIAPPNIVDELEAGVHDYVHY